MKHITLLSLLILTLSCTSCGTLTSFLGTPAGQATSAVAQALAKNLAKQGEASVLRVAINSLATQIALHEAKPVPTGFAEQMLLAAKIDGMKAAREASRQRYKELTGQEYPPPGVPATGK
jgi:hypothetical protein